MAGDNQPRIAVLDDYQGVALTFADWSDIQARAHVTVFREPFPDARTLTELLEPFQAVCVMRERTPLNRAILSQLPNLKLIVSTGKRNASIDMEAAAERGITVVPTGYHDSGAPEFTWALILALMRRVVPESLSVREGGWQRGVGTDVTGKTIGLVGLGNIGQRIARYAHAFDMNVIAWSPRLTSERAAEYGALLVTKEQLFEQADVVSIHLVLSSHSKGIVGGGELARMKPGAYFVNTSRGPLVDEAALIGALEQRKIAGAALDVYDREPLPPDHPFRRLENVLATPHIGYVTEQTYRVFYEDTVRVLRQWLG